MPSHQRPPRIPVLLGTQTLFNIGFYAVVPFIAVVLDADFGLGAAAVGLVLGVRTFAQQGMFLVGGGLADRIGARATILIGIAVRVSGFLALAASLWLDPVRLWLFVAGTVLTGLGGAFFSPGLSVLVAEADRATPPGRITLFAWLTVTGEIGTVVGPLLGTLLMPLGFAVTAATGAALFAGIWVLLFVLLPRGSGRGAMRGVDQRPESAPDAGGDAIHPPPTARDGKPFPALRDRPFVAFACLHSVDLLAYNQLYLTLPLALVRSGAGAGAVALMFIWVSILTLALQLPIARWAARRERRTALRAGYLSQACSYLVLAGGSATGTVTAPGVGTVLVMISVTFLILGHLAAQPTAMSFVPVIAESRPTGSYFGLLATTGGFAVLLGNVAAGRLMDLADAVPVAGAAPWLFLALLPAISALCVGRVLAALRRSGRG